VIFGLPVGAGTLRRYFAREYGMARDW
jgi:hypothetical protein